MFNDANLAMWCLYVDHFWWELLDGTPFCYKTHFIDLFFFKFRTKDMLFFIFP